MSRLEDFSHCVQMYSDWEKKAKINFANKTYYAAFSRIEDTLGNDNSEMEVLFPFYNSGFSANQISCIVMGNVIYNNLSSIDKRIDQDTIMENKQSLSEMQGLRNILVKRYKELAEAANIILEH